jgi:NADH-quinone oxidoreductase subunit M
LCEEPMALIVILGIAITAGLYLRAIGKVLFGAPREQWAGMPDLNVREVLTLAPLLVLIIFIGVAPSWLLGTIHQTTAALHF